MAAAGASRRSGRSPACPWPAWATRSAHGSAPCGARPPAAGGSPAPRSSSRLPASAGGRETTTGQASRSRSPGLHRERAQRGGGAADAPGRGRSAWRQRSRRMRGVSWRGVYVWRLLPPMDDPEPRTRRARAGPPSLAGCVCCGRAARPRVPLRPALCLRAGARPLPAGARWRPGAAGGGRGQAAAHAESVAELPTVGDWVAISDCDAELPRRPTRSFPRRSRLSRSRPGRRATEQVVAANVDRVIRRWAGRGSAWPARAMTRLAYAAGTAPVVPLYKARHLPIWPASGRRWRRCRPTFRRSPPSSRPKAARARSRRTSSPDAAPAPGSSGVAAATLLNPPVFSGRPCRRPPTSALSDRRGRHTTSHAQKNACCPGAWSSSIRRGCGRSSSGMPCAAWRPPSPTSRRCAAPPAASTTAATATSPAAPCRPRSMSRGPRALALRELPGAARRAGPHPPPPRRPSRPRRWPQVLDLLGSPPRRTSTRSRQPLAMGGKGRPKEASSRARIAPPWATTSTGPSSAAVAASGRRAAGGRHQSGGSPRGHAGRSAW